MGTGVTRQQDRAPEASLPAGVSVTGETTPVKGPGEEFSRLGDLLMAPGLALMGGVTIDRQPSVGGSVTSLARWHKIPACWASAAT